MAQKCRTQSTFATDQKCSGSDPLVRTKPEVQNALNGHQRSNEPRLQPATGNIYTKLG